MADYFTNISFSFQLPDEAAATDAVAMIQAIERYIEDRENNTRIEGFDEWAGEWLSLGIAAEAESDRVWIRDDGGCPALDLLVVCLQKILSRHDPDGIIGFEWSNDCTKHREDAFSGGAVLVTASNATWMTTSQWLDEAAAALQKERAEGTATA